MGWREKAADFDEPRQEKAALLLAKTRAVRETPESLGLGQETPNYVNRRYAGRSE